MIPELLLFSNLNQDDLTFVILFFRLKAYLLNVIVPYRGSSWVRSAHA